MRTLLIISAVSASAMVHGTNFSPRNIFSIGEQVYVEKFRFRGRSSANNLLVPATVIGMPSPHRYELEARIGDSVLQKITLWAEYIGKMASSLTH